jgi:CRISP-associated protein Cas1
MSWQIIDVIKDGHYLHADREWIVVEENRVEIGRVPLTDIQSVLVHAGYATYSHGLLLRLAEYDIPLVICNHRHEPVSILLSLSGHHKQAGRIRAQSECGLPLRKRVWRDLVKKKIQEQAVSLKPFDRVGHDGLQKLASNVRSGDPDNVEARAARYYWPRLFDKTFRRDRQQRGLNAHLNYGYTILRSSVARAIIAAGLMPSLGVGHVNARNNFCLADDIMEPFRPLVDRLVNRNQGEWTGELTPQARIELAGMMSRSIQTEEGETDLFRTMTMVAVSLTNLFEGSVDKLYLPQKLAFVESPRFPELE